MNDTPWIATYRLQLHREFPFAAAEEILPYLATLGISHVYLSPILQAVPGSQHGYDGTDPTRISEDMGGEEGWQKFHAAARAHGLGILMDIVPNHMAVTEHNPWWQDVLTHGPFSNYAEHFDLFGARQGDHWKLNLATLGASVDELRDAGKFELGLKGESPCLVCEGQSWPIAPHAWGRLIEAESSPAVFQSLRKLSLFSNPDSKQKAEWRALHHEAEAVLKKYPALQKLSRDEMTILVKEQFYALHHWKDAGKTLNYRRFFDVTSLIGLRVESEEVFDVAHSRIARLIQEDQIDGLRVDHPDGLRDPIAFSQRLRSLLPEGRIYIEKILQGEERLSSDWQVNGTVGYEFLARLNRLWLDEQKAASLSSVYQRFTGSISDHEAMVLEKKRQVIDMLFPRELDFLTSLAISNGDDLNADNVRAAIKEITAQLPVYRTYRTPDQLSEKDRTLIVQTLAKARRALPEVGSTIFELLATLLLEESGDPAAQDFVARWQQFTGPAAAKGVEDTVFYNDVRLLAENEVGADVSQHSISAEGFHEFCSQLNEDWPENQLITSTHDTKRGEDVRARLAVLSEIPEAWDEMLHEWSKENQAAWKGAEPDRNAEYFIYQTLIGAWPLERERCQAYFLKAIREAKHHTSWVEPCEAYEAAISSFIDALYENARFIEGLESFVGKIAEFGHLNTLAQTLIKLTAPGVPDVYQGCELPEFSLVDPDNRRAVNYQQRVEMLSQLATSTEAPDWRLPEAKLWMIQRTLQLRRAKAECFASGTSYSPLSARGTRLRHLLAYARGEEVIVAVSRFSLSLNGDWKDTELPLPPGNWRDHFTGEVFSGDAPAAQLFTRFPVSLLVKTH